MDQVRDEAYRLSHELHLKQGRYQPSPYRPWSSEDMAWLAGADDASGDYPAAVDGQSSPSSSPHTKETQLTLF
ncbi:MULTISPECIES: hypothetical protein [Halomonadaceae]|uniref:Uncharacterized protein n=1 Tax=Vreelandella titanicae TaxID=664683 RepID=A0A558J1A0_9GAMM|nr:MULTISPECIES: hypothetical protein [Halomonas]EHA15296.1 hypothetical protein HAL1_12294 [Halomonas sp. HAL1]TVU87370.1 hypothetical protein FQP89_22595 [Halomonas titanicae]WKV95249.1 hypothetical protein Q3Y66_20335 [Halomonas sp. HAL1]